MDDRTGWHPQDAEDAQPLADEAAIAGNLWTRRSALALTAGFLALGTAPGRAQTGFTQVLQPRATQVVVSKSNRVLALLNGDKTLARYPIRLGFAPEGHKISWGDGRTPEGPYYIDRRNPRSEFFLSLGISYPNAADLDRARQLGVRAGGDIFIHGGPTNSAESNRKDWTAGCISVSNADMEQIWAMVPAGIPIIIYA